jgi:hypothetical protein
MISRTRDVDMQETKNSVRPFKIGQMPGEIACQPLEYLLRAKRYPIRIEISFRESGKKEWHEGRSMNISRTGILFRTEKELIPQTHLEMWVPFPKEIIGRSDVYATLRGVVIRSDAISGIDGPPAKAVAIRHYHLSNR